MAATTRLQLLEQFLADSPEDPEIHYAIAMEHLGQGDAPNAVQAFRKLIAVQPDYVPSYLMLGQTLIRLDESEQAAEVLRQGIAAAQRTRNGHAQSELQALLDNLD